VTSLLYVSLRPWIYPESFYLPQTTSFVEGVASTFSPSANIVVSASLVILEMEKSIITAMSVESVSRRHGAIVILVTRVI